MLIYAGINIFGALFVFLSYQNKDAQIDSKVISRETGNSNAGTET
jgi:hypothetical protein